MHEQNVISGSGNPAMSIGSLAASEQDFRRRHE